MLMAHWITFVESKISSTFLNHLLNDLFKMTIFVDFIMDRYEDEGRELAKKFRSVYGYNGNDYECSESIKF